MFKFGLVFSTFKGMKISRGVIISTYAVFFIFRQRDVFLQLFAFCMSNQRSVVYGWWLWLHDTLHDGMAVFSWCFDECGVLRNAICSFIAHKSQWEASISKESAYHINVKSLHSKFHDTCFFCSCTKCSHDSPGIQSSDFKNLNSRLTYKSDALWENKHRTGA